MKILIIVMICLLLYFYAIAPRTPRKNLWKPFCGVFFAHRGLFRQDQRIPENSMPAFREAVKRGFGIELDVQLTKDHQVVVFHDNTLSRVCGIDLLVKEKTYEELCQLTLFDTNYQIPLLTEVLAMVDGQIPLLVEIKSTEMNTKVCHYVHEILSQYHGDYCIESFNTLILRWYKKHQPQILRGQLSANLTNPLAEGGIFLSFIVKYLLSNFLGRPDFISYCHKDLSNISFLINKYIFHALTMGWTIRNKQEYDRCVHRIDSYIFENIFL